MLGLGLAAQGQEPTEKVLDLAGLLTRDGRLRLPANYRQWIFLSSGHGMSYSLAAAKRRALPFDNVFVDPVSYRRFVETGTWPDGTIFILEVRQEAHQRSINRHGAFQQGEPTAIEVHAKDSTRFSSGWAFFSFEGRGPAERIPPSAECYSCHQKNGAVDTTFVQFYPTLLPLAEMKRTLSSAYLKQARAESAQTAASAK